MSVCSFEDINDNRSCLQNFSRSEIWKSLKRIRLERESSYLGAGHIESNSEVCKWIYEISLSVRNIPVYGKACKCIYDIFELSWKIWRQLLHNSRSCELHGHGFKSRSGFLILLSGFRRIILLWYALHVLRWFHAILPNWRQISRDDVCR